MRTVATPPTPPARARRGRVAVHEPETLLDLVAAMTRAAAQAGHAVAAEQVSMPVFSRVKLDVGAARGIANPRTDRARAPSADAIQMRFQAACWRAP